MVNNHLTEYLNYYLKLDNPQYAVLLTGKWGCGKTFYIKHLIGKWENKEVSDNDIVLKPIYVSLNGVDDIKAINSLIKKEISSFITKVGDVTKVILKGLIKTSLKIDLDLNKDGDSDGSISFSPDLLDLFRSSNESVKGDKIIIFDDIERCKIETDKLFGYINNFVEHLRCKVILLTDEDKLRLKYKNSNDISYKDFKEKLIGQTFEVNTDVAGALEVFIDECERINSDINLSSYIELIINIFNASKKENLRVLRQALLDFHRFTTFFDNSFATHSRYDEFIKNILSYFIIVYLELKTGNVEIHKFQNPLHLYLSKDEDENVEEKKYQPILENYGVSNSMYILPLDNIIQYIEKGYIEKGLLKNLMFNSIFFLTDETPNWEKLWRWRELEDKNFKELRDSVWKDFMQGDIDDPLVVTHTADILLSLIEERLLQKKKSTVVARAIQILNQICTNEYLLKNNNYGFLSNSREYHNSTCFELNEIKDFLSMKVEDGRKYIYDIHVKEIFENLQDGDINSQIYPKLSEALPDFTTNYNYTAIFKSVDGKKLGRKLKTFSPKSIIQFRYFIQYRYFPEKRYSNGRLEDYHKGDKKSLIELREELQKGLKVRERIKNIAINELSEEIGNVVIKLQEL